MTITGNLTTDSEGNILQVGFDVKLITFSQGKVRLCNVPVETSCD